MSFVIPKWTAHAAKDWNDLLIQTAEGETQLNEATAALLNYLPIIGVTELKSENVDDAWRRIAIHQALFGSFLSDGAGKRPTPMFFTKSDVE